MIDVSPVHLQTILEILSCCVPGCEVRAFGSRYKWTAKDYSDLDLVIVGESKHTLEEISALREAFQESDLPFRVDVLDWHAISPEFQQVIEQGYEVIQKSGSAAGNVVMSAGEWKKHKLEDLADFHDSKRRPLNSREREDRNGDFPYYGASGIVDYIDGYIFDGEYVLISEDGENLRSRTTPIAYKVNGKFWVNNHAHVIQGKEKYLNDWIIYFFQNFDLNPYITGAVQPKLNKENLQLIEIPMPDIEDAKKIVSILSALDDKIDLNRRMNRTLETLAQAVFRHWFVEQVESDWEVKSLDEIADFLNGLALQKYPADEMSDFLPVIKIAQLRKKDTIDADRASTNIPPEYIVNDGDILFSWSGSLEVVVWCGGKGALNQHLFKVTSKKYPKWFYYLWTKYHLPEFQEIAAGKATTMGHIQRHHLSNAKVLVPSDMEITEMDNVMSHILDKIITNEKESRTLAALRDSLLPKLMRGEVRVKDIQHA